MAAADGFSFLQFVLIIVFGNFTGLDFLIDSHVILLVNMDNIWTRDRIHYYLLLIYYCLKIIIYCITINECVLL